MTIANIEQLKIFNQNICLLPLPDECLGIPVRFLKRKICHLPCRRLLSDFLISVSNSYIPFYHDA